MTNPSSVSDRRSLVLSPASPLSSTRLSRKLLAECEEIVEPAGGDGEDAVDIDCAVLVSDQVSQTRRRTKSTDEI